MPELRVYRGVPGSGKTTASREWVAESPLTRVRVNRDDLRMMFYGKKIDLAHEQEIQINRAEEALARTYLAKGLDVAIDATHLKRSYVTRWEKINPVTLVEVNSHESVIWERNLTRPEEDRIPHNVLTNFLLRFYTKDGNLRPLDWENKPTQERVPYVNEHVFPPAIIVDIDGTLAHMTGRSPYDYTRVSEDVVDEVVLNLIDLQPESTEIIFLSGREDSCYDDTYNWLSKNMGREDFHLFMRETGDGRDDSVVKYEIFDREIRNNWSVKFVLDDRNRVVDMWRSIGLKCLQVEPGDF